MTIMELLKEKNLSRYSLSKQSGVPWATLSDICSGKTKLENCNGTTLLKLSRVLEISIEKLLELEQTPAAQDGKPVSGTYLETGLTATLQQAIADLVQGERNKVNYLDCLLDNLYGSINADFWAGCITEEQANYLRNKYLYHNGGELA